MDESGLFFAVAMRSVIVRSQSPFAVVGGSWLFAAEAGSPNRLCLAPGARAQCLHKSCALFRKSLSLLSHVVAELLC